jgi:hypothetical protein
MESNRLFMTVVAVTLLAVSCFTMGFVVGRHHEREHGADFNLRINDQQISVERKENGKRGRIIAPFVDIEYDTDSR